MHRKKMKRNFYLPPYTNINSKWIKKLNLRGKNWKLLGDNMRISI